MPLKKRITIGDLLAHLRAFEARVMPKLNKIDKIDGIDARLIRVEKNVQKLNERVETMLIPSHQRLQITVRSHSERIRKLERAAA